jgi:molybdopterin converting factor small subunit
MRVQIEMWAWLGEKLGGDFESPSEMRSVAALEVEEGLTVIDLFERLAPRYPLIAEKVFNRRRKKFYPALNVIVTRQGQMVSPFNIEENRLKDGDKITVMPLYAGG